jgi:hypothetical protein
VVTEKRLGEEMIEFLSDIEVEVVIQFDDELDEIVESQMQSFRKGEQIYADVVGDTDTPSIQIQFGDGSVTWLPKGSIKEI